MPKRVAHAKLQCGSNGHSGGSTAGLTPPPPGMRSAVPLGGLGAGALELRADGTFNEVTIHNAHPSGGAKYGVLAEAMLGLRIAPVGGAPAVARALRTAPPPYAAGVASLAYSGTHPASRLTVRDTLVTGVSTSLYAYSVLKPGDEAASAHPAVAFSLLVNNGGAVDADVSLYFQLPWGAINDCDRTGNGSSVVATAPAASPAACSAACAAASAPCAAWTWMPANDGTCSLTSDAPWPRFRAGYACAVSGAWAADAGTSSLTFTADAHGAAAAARAPGIGGVTLRAVGGVNASSSGFADDASTLWSAFASQGTLPGTAGDARAAGIGALAATVRVPAGASGTVSIVFAWHFPHKDWWHEEVGNFYANLWSSSADVAAELAADGRLAAVVGDLAAHHAVFVGPPADSALPPSPLPVWLRDALVNQHSHFREMHWIADGRMREYEAPDCPDIDSVHNDYQRHLPYLWAAPRFELSKFDRYATGQLSDGHIPEYLGSFGLGPLDASGGRTMADTTTLWIVELYEFYTNTANLSLVQHYWPVAQRAIAWQIDACKQIGLPWRLVCTYDIIDFQQYNTSAFNSFVHLAAMRAGAALARAVGDNATAAAADAAFVRGQGALESVLWNAEGSFFRAYTGANALMGDTLYGQVVALHHGLGWLTPEGPAGLALLSSHLDSELAHNGNLYGLQVVTGRPPPGKAVTDSGEPERPSRFARLGIDTTNDVNWQGAGPDWSYVAIALARQAAGPNVPLAPDALATALEPARKAIVNQISRINDAWNIAGIVTSGDWSTNGDESANGQSYITSHYGFLLVDYYLLPALTGQHTNLPAGALTFDPVFPAPYTLPVLLQGVEGTLSRTASGVRTLSLAFGSLTLPAGGLVVSGVPYPSAVSIVAGQSVTW